MPASPKHSKATSRTLPKSQPELLARHCTEAGQIEKAVGLWAKAGQRSQQRSALVEAVEQFKFFKTGIAIARGRKPSGAAASRKGFS
jgi:hypothetical protein